MKKRMIFLFLAIAALLAFAGLAQADVGDLPGEIRSSGDLSGQTLMDAAYSGSTSATPEMWFVLARNAKGTNTLYAYKWAKSQWMKAFSTSKAVPQGTDPVYVTLSLGGKDAMNGVEYSGRAIHIDQRDSAGRTVIHLGFRLTKAGKWMLFRLYSQTGAYNSMEFGDGYITYFRSADSRRVSGTAYGTFQRDLRYMSLAAVPKTLREAENKLTTMPDMPVDSELRSEEVEFTGGKKYAVYSAPSKNSIRANNSKASVSTNGWIQVFGEESGWILIQYSIDANHYRFGYIDSKALPKKASVSRLDFDAVSARALYTVSVTDDPLYSHASLTTLQEGTEVLWLATVGNWAYIEGSNYRGFVPMEAVSTGRGSDSAADSSRWYVYTGSDGQQYELFEICKLIRDGSGRVTGVTGRFARIVTGEDGTDESALADGGRVFSYVLSADFRARMPESMFDVDRETEITDLYQWYVSSYLEGEAPAGGELTYAMDLPDDETDAADFWFVTTRIQLNAGGEIQYMDYAYVPWG